MTKKIIHVLPGDAIAENFKAANIEGETLVCRECLIEGDKISDSLEDFWRVRAGFIGKTYGENERFYAERVASEFRKLEKLEDDGGGDEVNLWFEYELFCQANMWFCLRLLADKSVEIYRVAPVVRDEKDLWSGFGELNADDLKKCFARRVKFTREDARLGEELWKAFCRRDFEKLRALGETESECFPHLSEVCAAAIELETRPKQTLEAIVAAAAAAGSGESNFDEIFAAFQKSAGVYGFGDEQVKRLMREI
jgi:hypothetical protein